MQPFLANQVKDDAEERCDAREHEADEILEIRCVKVHEEIVCKFRLLGKGWDDVGRVDTSEQIMLPSQNELFLPAS